MKSTCYSKTKLWAFVVHFFLFGSTSGLPKIDRRQLPDATNTRAEDGGVARCRCAPDQWEGLMMSVEREFEARNGVKPLDSSMAVSIHYDYVNGKFAMTDLKNGRRTVAHYRQGTKYVITKSGCFKLFTDQPMTKMCLPDEAELVGNFRLGTDIPVGVWQYSGSNVSTRTTVMAANCVPVLEEVYWSNGGHSLLTTSQYVDMTLGIADETVFDVPPECWKPVRRISVATTDSGSAASGSGSGIGGEGAADAGSAGNDQQLIDDVNGQRNQQSSNRSKRRQHSQLRQVQGTSYRRPVSLAQTILES